MALGVTMGVIGGALIAGLVFWLVRRWKKKQQQLEQTKATTAYEIDDHRHVAHARETGRSPVTEMHATPGTTPVWAYQRSKNGRMYELGVDHRPAELG